MYVCSEMMCILNFKKNIIAKRKHIRLYISSLSFMHLFIYFRKKLCESIFYTFCCVQYLVLDPQL